MNKHQDATLHALTEKGYDPQVVAYLDGGRVLVETPGLWRNQICLVVSRDGSYLTATSEELQAIR